MGPSGSALCATTGAAGICNRNWPEAQLTPETQSASTLRRSACDAMSTRRAQTKSADTAGCARLPPELPGAAAAAGALAGEPVARRKAPPPRTSPGRRRRPLAKVANDSTSHQHVCRPSPRPTTHEGNMRSVPRQLHRFVRCDSRSQVPAGADRVAMRMRRATCEAMRRMGGRPR